MAILREHFERINEVKEYTGAHIDEPLGRASLAIGAQHSNEQTLAAYEDLYRTIADGARGSAVAH